MIDVLDATRVGHITTCRLLQPRQELQRKAEKSRRRARHWKTQEEQDLKVIEDVTKHLKYI